jgi:hypothetical protein
MIIASSQAGAKQLAPADRDPGIRWRELEVFMRTDHRHPVA